MFIKLLDNFYMRYIINFFFFMLQPSYWLQLRKTSLKWDKQLWNKIRSTDFILNNDLYKEWYTITFSDSDKEVWVKNFPYRFANVWTGGVAPEKYEVLPLSITRWYLNKLVKDKIAAKEQQGVDASYWESI